MPTFSTPASPTPFADDGEELMLVLRDFLSASLSFQKNPNSLRPDDALAMQSLERNADSALRLLKNLPVSKEAVFEFFALVIDVLSTHERKKPADIPRQLVSTIDKLHKTLSELIKSPKLGPNWSPIIVHWTLDVLGEMSSKQGKSSRNLINEDLSAWMSSVSGSNIADLAAECMTRLNENQTEDCISHLLDLSVRHGSNFDWVVAHIGGCYPEIVITRVLSVGLKSQKEMAKVNSAVGILSHVGATHKSEVKACVQKLLSDSEDPLVIPYLLNLSSLSALMASTVMSVASEVISLEMAEKICALMPIWEKASLVDTKEDGLAKLSVNLLMKHGSFGLVRNLLDFSGDSNDKDVMYGSRYILDQLLVELHGFVHVVNKREENSLLKECSLHWSFLMDHYLFGQDSYRKKTVSMLLNCIFLHEGRTLTAMAIQKGLCRRAETDDELSAVLLLIKDVEMWMPEVVSLAIKLCFRAKDKKGQFLCNLGKILHYQNEANSGDMIETDVYQYVKLHHEELVSMTADPSLIADVLKILNFVPLPDDQPLSVSLMHKAANNLAKALFICLSRGRDEEIHQDLAQIIEHLQVLANSTVGLPMVLRSLLIGAMNPSVSVPLFGGRQQGQEVLKPNQTCSLFEENLKFGAMPTHPLGTSTVFHAGIIGEGKRKVAAAALENETTKENSLIFVSILFKVCDEVTVMAKEETYKQLALLLVDLVSPDVMYNGLPWPEEDFTRVTMERDLQIVKCLEDNPIIWKVLWGLAEARPALCYCSVILRGALSVQMAHWAAALKATPKVLTTTQKILWLMSVGQFLPHPLDSVADVIEFFNPYQVHCILVDVWNYVRDNVPSPVAFVTNGKNCATRKFGPYINHKQYCERLRLIMMQHISKVAHKYQQFFAVKVNQDHSEPMQVDATS